MLLLNTNNIRSISDCTGSTILNKILTFPSLETLETNSFIGVKIEKLKNLGIITYIPTSCFTGARIN